MKIGIDTFAGIVPRVSARLLSANQAQISTNARLDSGDLEAWRGVEYQLDVSKSGTIQSLYLFEDQYWFQWNVVVDVVRGPVPKDTTKRTYFTGFGEPRFTDNSMALAGASTAYPVNSRTLGIPAPAAGLAVSVAGTATEDDPALIDTRFYTYTYVSDHGEEGPPAPASNSVDVLPGQRVNVSGISAPSGGEYVIETARIYRTTSSGSATEFQFVDEIAVGQSTYSDTVEAESLGELLPSETWIAPPEDMHSLVVLPNGILAGASGLDICISEQYLPHAWPLDYRHTADDEVVGLGVVGNSLIVLTGRRPYVITGSSPASMAMATIGSDEFACVSKRGIAVLPRVGVVFPTPDGLGAITSNGAVNLTDAYMRRQDWQAYAPESMLGVAHEGRYYAFYDNGTPGCLVFDPEEQDGALYEIDLTADAAYRDPETDTLYLVVNREIVAWDRAAAAHATYQWRSKRYELPIPASFSIAKIRADDYNDIALTLYADGAEVAALEPINDHAFRLPIMQRASVWELELSGTSRVHDIQISDVFEELT